MFSHHILSIFLITGSYYGNFTRIGTVVHVFMDFCDILLPVRSPFPLPKDEDDEAEETNCKANPLLFSWPRCSDTSP